MRAIKMAQTTQRQTHCKSTIRNSGRLRNATHHSIAVVCAVVCAVAPTVMCGVRPTRPPRLEIPKAIATMATAIRTE